MSAQSGQLQRSVISLGAGNSPLPGWLMRAITASLNRPCSRPTSESIDPAQSATMACHLVSGSAVTLISTRYRLEPITWARTSPRTSCRSITEPLRT